MTEHKHTPGNWWINDLESDEESISIAADEQEHFRIGYAIDDWGDPEQMKANALLFAAAPDLLEALEALITPHDKGWKVDDMAARYDAARTAIAKAKGA